MAQPAKFTFDNEFETPSRPASQRNGARIYKPDEIDAIRAEGFAEGHAEAVSGAEQAAATAFEEIARMVQALTGAIDTERERLETDARTLAILVARKLVPTLMAHAPLAEIEALITDTLSHIPDQPHVVVRVGEKLIDNLKPRAEAIARAQGFTGKLIFLAEPGMTALDCRIEYADGGARRDTAALTAEIDAAIARHIGQDDDSGADTPAPDPAAGHAAPEETDSAGERR